jgi:hypothetical protein
MADGWYPVDTRRALRGLSDEWFPLERIEPFGVVDFGLGDIT